MYKVLQYLIYLNTSMFRVICVSSHNTTCSATLRINHRPLFVFTDTDNFFNNSAGGVRTGPHVVPNVLREHP